MLHISFFNLALYLFEKWQRTRDGGSEIKWKIHGARTFVGQNLYMESNSNTHKHTPRITFGNPFLGALAHEVIIHLW